MRKRMESVRLFYFYVLLVVGLVMLSPVAGWAQFENASVLGYVRDKSGAVVSGATVTLTNSGTNVSQTAKTDGEGKFEFNSVNIGTYVVTAEASGFQTTKTAPFQLQVNARQRVDVEVAAGSVSDTVEVTAAAQVLDTETSSRSTVVGTREVENLPLNGRSYADLVLLVPGARKSALQNQSTSSREASFNINGQRSAFNNFLLDGLDNNNYGTSNQGFANENIPPSPDAISEFRVEVNNYSAEYGRSTGAVINAAVRRGSNQFHGRAWDYHRNGAFNAIGPFLASGATKPKFIRNQFGGTFGGPIWKDHTFFFADYEGMRLVQNFASVLSSLPTADQRAGNFGAGKVIRNPITGATYTNGVLPSSEITTFAKNVLAALPATNNGTANTNNFVITPRGVQKDDKGDVRVDHTFNDHWTVFGRYSQHAGYIFDPPSIPGRAGGNSNGNVNIKNRAIAAGVTWTISANKLLDVRFGWSKNEGGKFPIGLGQASILTESGITNGIPTDPGVVRPLNGQSVTGFTQFGAQTSNPQFQNPTIFNPKVNYTWLRGKHSLKFGYEFQAVHTQVNDFNPSYGQDNYAGQFSRPSGSSTFSDTTNQQIYNLADFMMGNRSAYSLTTYAVVNLRQRYNFMYVQDDIKVTPKLTVNAGLRYEIVTPQWERDNKLANFDPTAKALIQAKDGSIADRAQVNTPLTNIGPRFGFSYSANNKTVLRGGYGIGYTQWNRAGGENNLTYNGPNVVNASITQVAPTAAVLCTNDTQVQASCFRQTQQGYAVGLTAPANFNPLNVLSRYIPKNFKTGYVQSYHFGIQQQLPWGIVADLAYVGNKATHLQVLADYNQAVTGAGSLQSRRPVSNFAGIEIAYGSGSANYNSMQFKVEKRSQIGLYVMNSFTWSRTFDISSGHLETSGGDNSRVNYANPSNDYGPSGYDQPLADTTSIVYDLPFGRGRKYGSHAGYLTDALFGGWQITSINTMTSGLPINVTYSLSSSSPLYVSDLVTYRPDRVAGAPILGSARTKTKGGALNGYFNVNAFATPATSWGSSTRNLARGYGFFQTDMGLHKAFRLWSDSSSFDFRAEAFNILNKVNYAQPNSSWSSGSSSFGQITSIAGNPRQLQLAAKVIF